MQLITNERGQIMCYDTYLHDISQVISGILLDYITKKGLQFIYAGCFDGAIQDVVWDSDGDDNNNTNNWFVEEQLHQLIVLCIGLDLLMQGHMKIYYHISVLMVAWMI